MSAFKDLDLNSTGDPDNPNDPFDGVAWPKSDPIEVSMEEKCDMGGEAAKGQMIGSENLGGEGSVDKVDINSNVEMGVEEDKGTEGLADKDVERIGSENQEEKVGALGCEGTVEKGCEMMEVEVEREESGGPSRKDGDREALGGGVTETTEEGGVTVTTEDLDVGALVCDFSVSPEEGHEPVEVHLERKELDRDQEGSEAEGEGRLDRVDTKANVENKMAEDQNMGTLVCDISIYPEKGCEAMEVDLGRKESDGSGKQDGEASSFTECNMGSLVVDLGPAFGNEAEGSDRLENVMDGGGVGKEIVETTKHIALIKQPKEGGFSNSELVWGKVRSHPWWPGQIVDPSYASELAMKFYKKDTHLVAYFGDRSFAWNEPLTLNPFKDHFSQLEKQTNAVAFCNAVSCSLDEVSRQVQLGLSCSCLPEEIYNVTKLQIVVNAGVQENVCIIDGVDRSFGVTSFEPSQLLGYIKSLAVSQENVGRMELVIAQAQIVAFYSSKGYFQVPEFHVSNLLSEHTVDATPGNLIEQKPHSGKGSGRSRRRNKSYTKALDSLEDSLDSKKKQRSLAELMEPKNLLIGDNEKGGSKSVVPYSGTKRKNIESYSGVTTPKRGRSGLLTSTDSDVCTESPISRDPKVGQRIRNIARQLSGSPPVLKLSGDTDQKSDFKVDDKNIKLHEVGVSTQVDDRTLGRIIVPNSSLEEMLSQLYEAAQDPMKGYNIVGIVVGFFTDFRNSTARGRSFSVKSKKSEKTSGDENILKKRKQSNSKVHSTESYDNEAVSDSYWTDRVILSSPDELVSGKKQKRKTNSSVEIPLKSSSTVELQTSHDLSPVSDSKKNTSTLESINELQPNPSTDYTQKCTAEHSELSAEKSVDNKKSEEISPTSLILNFTDSKSIPLEPDLNRIFSPYKSLKESETKILRKTKQARVVFERHSDAEEAFTRACKFTVFGPALVSYRLTPYKASPLTRRQTKKDATLLQGGNSN